MRFFQLVFLAACATVAPPVVVPTPPPAPAADPIPVSTITITVPSNCSHLILDVDSKRESDLMVACFSGSERTYFKNERGPPLGTPTGDGQRLVISYSGHDADPSAR